MGLLTMVEEIINFIIAYASMVSAIAAAGAAGLLYLSYENSKKPILKISLQDVGDIYPKQTTVDLQKDIKLKILNSSVNTSHNIRLWKYLEYKGKKLKLMPINIATLFSGQTYSEDILIQIIARLRELGLIEKDKFPPMSKEVLDFVISIEGKQESDTGKGYKISERFLIKWHKEMFSAEIINMGVDDFGEFTLDDLEFVKAVKALN